MPAFNRKDGSSIWCAETHGRVAVLCEKMVGELGERCGMRPPPEAGDEARAGLGMRSPDAVVVNDAVEPEPHILRSVKGTTALAPDVLVASPGAHPRGIETDAADAEAIKMRPALISLDGVLRLVPRPARAARRGPHTAGAVPGRLGPGGPYVA